MTTEGRIVGGVPGVGPERARRRPLGRLSQWLLALAAGVLVPGCWGLALAGHWPSLVPSG